MMQDKNRLKIILVEKKVTATWLAQQLGKDQATVSKWCKDTSQPDIETCLKIARLLKVDFDELLTKQIKREVAMSSKIADLYQSLNGLTSVS